MQRRPDFLGIGVQKAGSTWLASVLRQHPDIWLPPIKELHYFDELFGNVERGDKSRYFSEDSYVRRRWRRYLSSGLKMAIRYPTVKNVSWILRFLFGTRTLDKYSRLFAPAGGLTCGEITPAYSILEEFEVRRIRAVYPHLKILILLRNPVERSWSHAKMELLMRRNRPIGSVGESELETFLFGNEAVFRRSSYRSILKNWIGAFGQDQVRVDIFEDLRSSEDGVVAGILGFLGVDKSVSSIPDMGGSRFKGVEGGIPNRFRDMLKKRHVEDINAVADLTGRSDIYDIWS